MRRIVRLLPAFLLGAVLGLMAAFVVATLSTPFLARRVVDKTTLFNLRAMVTVLGVMGAVLGLLGGTVAAIGRSVLRRPTDPAPKKPPARLISSALLGGAIGGPFGALLSPILSALVGSYDNTRIEFSAGRYLVLVSLVGVIFGLATTGVVVAFAPSVAPVGRLARVRVQHLYDGPVTNERDLAVLINRIKEGGEDALAAGKEFHLS